MKHTRYHNNTLEEIIKVLSYVDSKIPRDGVHNSLREQLHDAISELDNRMVGWRGAFTFGETEDD